MKNLLYFFCLPFSLGLFAQDCELPEEFTGNTGSNMTVMLHSNLLSPLSFVSIAPYIVAVTGDDLVVGSSCIAPECLDNGNQQLVLWGDDSFSPELDGAIQGEIIYLQIVDSIYLYSLNVTINYSSNGVSIIDFPGFMAYICSGVIEGCMDQLACNYDSYATEDDGSCDYPEIYFDCESNCINDSDADGICDELEIIGCIEPMACNYHENATDEGTCIYADFALCESCSGETDGTGTIVVYDADEDGICDSIGCSDPEAMNYNPFATEEDGSCEYVHLTELNSLELTVYPNPIIDQMKMLSHKSYSQLQLTITNMIGSLVYHKTLQNLRANDLIEIDLQSLPSGMYMMRVSSSSAIISIPLIKK